MRYQFNLRDETDNIIRSIIRIHGHHTNNILVRLRALYGQDYLAYSAPSKLLRAHGSGSAAGSPEVAATKKLQSVAAGPAQHRLRQITLTY